MGQTLTHGVYLPDEGERNCYSGLAANWQILDSSVGTIAAHTAALSGKAPLVHTHTKSDITDFPAYGNAAGTICEGNDSRLSDARTPVAHTHTKSDVTDLFNSANAWAGNNSFYKNVALSEVALPADCTLGFTGLTSVIFYNTRGSSNVPSYGTFCHIGYSNTSPYRGAVIKMVRSTDKRGETNDGYVPDTSFNLWQLHVANKFFDFMEAVRVTNNGTENSLKPITDNATDLGTSTNKWKTLNGINPGALSLPDYNNVLDVTSNIPVASLDGTTQINLNDYLADKTGWLSIVIDDTAGNSIMVTQGKTGGATAYNNSRTFHTGAQSNGYISVFFPMIAGLSQKAFIKASSLIQMRFYYCLGNV